MTFKTSLTNEVTPFAPLQRGYATARRRPPDGRRITAARAGGLPNLRGADFVVLRISEYSVTIDYRRDRGADADGLASIAAVLP
jgi:hypothetical protein